MRAPLLLLLLGLVLRVAAQGYTYRVGQYGEHGTGLSQDVTLKAGESLYIVPYAVYTGRVSFAGTGQRIVNDWIWIAPPVALPAGATFTNHYLCSLERLSLAAGATFHNAGECAVTALDIAAGGAVQNDAPAWLQVYSPAFANAGRIRNCGVFLAPVWPPGPGQYVECGPLPVELLRFTARPEPGGVALAWAVAQEVNVARYEVERSADGRVFAPLSQQRATGSHAYAATDRARPGTQYYRLRTVDADGTAAYSPVAVVAGAALVSQAWYNEIGQRLAGPRPGFLIEVSTYSNGAVESRKYLQE